MKTQILNLQTVKVEIEYKELQKFGISYADLDYKNAATKKLINKILNKVAIITDMDLMYTKVIIEVFPEDNGGCIMYINYTENYDNNFVNKGLITEPRNKKLSDNCTALFKFNNINDLSKFCSLIYPLISQDINRQKLYRYNKNYIYSVSYQRKLHNHIICAVTECSDLVCCNNSGCSSQQEIYYMEHGDLLFENDACDDLGKFI